MWSFSKFCASHQNNDWITSTSTLSLGAVRATKDWQDHSFLYVMVGEEFLFSYYFLSVIATS